MPLSDSGSYDGPISTAVWGTAKRRNAAEIRSGKVRRSPDPRFFNDVKGSPKGLKASVGDGLGCSRKKFLRADLSRFATPRV